MYAVYQKRKPSYISDWAFHFQFQFIVDSICCGLESQFMKKRLSRSVRKFIRKEKARIRLEFFDIQIREEKIKELLQKIKKPL